MGYQNEMPCRSENMKLEEIERERAMSGWNQYVGEEEQVQMERADERYRAQEPNQETMWQIKEQEARERDLRHLQALYPETARILLPYVEEACDRLEYEGSMMYDERPDYETILRISADVLEQVKDQFEPIEEAPRDEMLSMQYRRPKRRRRSGNWLGDFVQTMLLEEMHRRRCRRCRMR